MDTLMTHPPATIDGLRQYPCDPLILAIPARKEPLRGLTGRIDWHLGGLISDQIRNQAIVHDQPVLRPPHPLLPCGRLIFWRLGAATPDDMASRIKELGGSEPGLCPQDFDFSHDEVIAAFREQVRVYMPPREQTR